MEMLTVRERVRLEGRTAEFIIVSVDRERQLADLIPAERTPSPSGSQPA
jgi:hypothetical protein